MNLNWPMQQATYAAMPALFSVFAMIWLGCSPKWRKNSTFRNRVKWCLWTMGTAKEKELDYYNDFF